LEFADFTRYSFRGPNGPEVADSLMEILGGKQVVHGHSVIADQAPRWLGESAGPLSHDMLGASASEPTLFPRPGFASGYQQLQGLLVNLARPGSLLVVLDTVNRVHDEEQFTAELLLPAANGQLRGVQLVVAGQSQRVRDLASMHLRDKREIELKRMPKEEAVSLVSEYLTRSRPCDVDAAKWAAYR
ncbi:hypothetical protein ACFQ1S_44445, partial [Kibdelosporangium lantanae]